jgi:hypothetical protein
MIKSIILVVLQEENVNIICNNSAVTQLRGRALVELDYN